MPYVTLTYVSLLSLLKIKGKNKFDQCKRPQKTKTGSGGKRLSEVWKKGLPLFRYWLDESPCPNSDNPFNLKNEEKCKISLRIELNE